MKNNDNEKALFSYLSTGFEKFDGIFDYLIMQPRIDLRVKLAERKKVAFIRGRVSHICAYSKGKGTFATEQEILQYAKRAFDDYKAAIGDYSWLDQLVRVDVM